MSAPWARAGFQAISWGVIGCRGARYTVVRAVAPLRASYSAESPSAVAALHGLLRRSAGVDELVADAITSSINNVPGEAESNEKEACIAGIQQATVLALEAAASSGADVDGAVSAALVLRERAELLGATIGGDLAEALLRACASAAERAKLHGDDGRAAALLHAAFRVVESAAAAGGLTAADPAEAGTALIEARHYAALIDTCGAADDPDAQQMALSAAQNVIGPAAVAAEPRLLYSVMLAELRRGDREDAMEHVHMVVASDTRSSASCDAIVRACVDAGDGPALRHCVKLLSVVNARVSSRGVAAVLRAFEAALDDGAKGSSGRPAGTDGAGGNGAAAPVTLVQWRRLLLSVTEGCERPPLDDAHLDDWAVLIDAHARCSPLRKAFGVFEEVQAASVEPSVSMYVALVRACRLAGQPKRAAKLVKHMEEALGRTPPINSYEEVILAAAQTGQAELAVAWLRRAAAAGHSPTETMYSTVRARAGCPPFIAALPINHRSMPCFFPCTVYIIRLGKTTPAGVRAWYTQRFWVRHLRRRGQFHAFSPLRACPCRVFLVLTSNSAMVQTISALADGLLVTEARELWHEAMEAGFLQQPTAMLRFGDIHLEGAGLSPSALTIVVHDAMEELRRGVIDGEIEAPANVRIYHDRATREHLRAVLLGLDPPLPTKTRRGAGAHLVVAAEDVVYFITSLAA